MGRSNKGKKQEESQLNKNNVNSDAQRAKENAQIDTANTAIKGLQQTPGFTNQEIAAQQGEQAAQLHGLYGGANDSILRHAAVTGHANDAGYGAQMSRNITDRAQAIAGGKLSIQRDNANQSVMTRRMIPSMFQNPIGALQSGVNAYTGANSSLIDSRMQADNAPTFLQQMALAGISAAGAVGAGAAGKPSCWIAEVLWGVEDRRTHLVRHWLGAEFKPTLLGGVVMAAYCKFGRQVAALAKRSKLLRTALTPLFNRALHKALDSAIAFRVAQARS